MSDFSEQLKALRSSNNHNRLTQSKRDSLRMNALKTISPIVLKNAITTNFDNDQFLPTITNSIRDIVSMQNEIESSIFSISGSLGENESFVYRRTWSLASTLYNHGNSNKDLRYVKFQLALISNSEASQRLLERCGFNEDVLDQYRDIISSLSTNFEQQDDAYSSTVDATLNIIAVRIQKLVNEIDFGSTKEDACELAINGVAVFTSRYIQCFKDTPNERQETMRIKSCLNHASKMFLSVMESLAKPLNGMFNISTFEKFESELLGKTTLISESLTYLVELITDVLLERENTHLVNVNQTKDYQKNSDLPLDVIINALHWPYEYTGAFYSAGQNELIAINNHIVALNSIMTLKNEFISSVSKQASKISKFDLKSLDKAAYKEISKAIILLIKNDIHLNVKMYKASLNMVVYLNSELPVFNKTLTTFGLDENLITNYRNELQKTLSTINVNEFNIKKIKATIQCYLAGVVIPLNIFSWGVNTGYISGHVSTAILKEALSFYNYKIKTVKSINKVTLYDCCLQQVCRIYLDRWMTEAKKTLNQSPILYSQGKISLSETQKIITRLTLQVSEDMYQLSKCYNKVRKSFSYLLNQSMFNGIEKYSEVKIGSKSNTIDYEQSEHLTEINEFEK